MNKEYLEWLKDYKKVMGFDTIEEAAKDMILWSSIEQNFNPEFLMFCFRVSNNLEEGDVKK